MEKLKKVFLIVITLLLLVVIGIVIFIITLKPNYSGEQELKNLKSAVSVYYDTYGIPHIYGESETDAFRTLGYVHAQDRLWQMELLRRIGPGRLSEVFGKDMIPTDKFLISLGIDEASEKTAASLDENSETIRLTRAYLEGVNSFIENGPTPVEFYLTGIEKTPFVVKDVYNTIGYMAFSFAMAHKTDPLLTNIKEKLGSEYLKDLEVNADPSLTTIANYPKNDFILKNTISEIAFQALKKLPVPMFEGSNSWVLSPEKTKNGKVIFANDPHIGFSQPSVWYEAHVSTPTYEKYGYHLAGVPFPLLGHDRNLAYGLTMFENDDIDFYYEEEHPTDKTKYSYKGAWKTYETVTKTIKVKDADAVAFTYKKTIHGPVLNGIADQIVGDKPIAMSWVYTRVENKTLNAFNSIVHANALNDFKKALAGIHAPGLNIMYGDAKGNIAWFATAKLYQMPDSINTKFVLEGSSGAQEPLRYLDFEENPHAINPPWNYVYSANNQPDSILGKIYPGYYLPENRAKRITQLLAPKNDWDKDAVSKMITDVTSAINPSVVRNLINEIDVSALSENQKQLIHQLKEWQGEATLENVETTMYHRWIYFFMKNTFSDELSEEQFTAFLGTHFFKRTIAPMAEKRESIWWDDIGTPEKETKKVMVNKSFQQAYAALEKSLGEDTQYWTWNKVHSIEHPHPIGQVEALRNFFNVGPFEVNGTREVINNLSFAYTEDGLYKVLSGPSTRRIIDFSDVENSISILPTGQSGNMLSNHYQDQAKMYVNGEFRKMMMNKEEITATAESVLIFKPL
ncbi:Acyl-homoserine-lactone acylase [Cellulophaga algicola DSM 14237]|uniref:Acyl-homoserine-lactone acylase n=1 Tax=Cellulophaga algicola (strain DSM 14237 / IC166 / ACAM 630) TaxID=688270 RepID=E6X989_CELAD|nr:penicillin acylase family protein [Cellulophaga algicola]ADV50899.1 Acyl-homoserine-lactone acylase [Cellulophaga algicola DSM 14237]